MTEIVAAGATGYIGRHVVAALDAREHRLEAYLRELATQPT